MSLFVPLYLLLDSTILVPGMQSNSKICLEEKRSKNKRYLRRTPGGPGWLSQKSNTRSQIVSSSPTLVGEIT